MEPSTNCTSTAGPATWITCPTFSGINEVSGRSSLVVRGSLILVPCYCMRSCRSLASLGMTNLWLLCGCSTYYLYNFFRDLGLARAIHYQGQRIDHIAGVAGGRIHGGHAGGVLGSYGLKERVKNLNADVLRQNALEKLFGRLLVNVVNGQGGKFSGSFIGGAGVGWEESNTLPPCGLHLPLAFFWSGFFGHLDVDFAYVFDGEQALHYQALRDDGFEFVEEEVDRVDLGMGIAGYHTPAEFVGKVIFDLA